MIVSTFRGLLFFLFLLTPLSLTAQESPEIQVEEQSFNFGLIPEEKGSVGHSFKFRNSGTAPLVITRVTADCGCTTPAWPEEAIAPGEKAEIRVLFDPIGRAGAFVKRIRVFSNAPSSPLELSISGTVTTLGGAMPHAYALAIGPLQVSNARLLFPISMPEDEGVVRLVVNNTDESDLQVAVVSLPSFVSLDDRAFRLQAREPRELNLSLAVPRNMPPGMKDEPLVLEVISSETGIKAVDSVLVSLPLVDNFPALTAAQTGVMELSTYLDMGQLDGETTKVAIDIRNVGAGPLRLHSVTTRNPALTAVADRTEIKPGGSTLLRIAVDSQVMKAEGWQSIAADISIICNDPQAPLRRIKVKAEL